MINRKTFCKSGRNQEPIRVTVKLGHFKVLKVWKIRCNLQHAFIEFVEHIIITFRMFSSPQKVTGKITGRIIFLARLYMHVTRRNKDTVGCKVDLN